MVRPYEGLREEAFDDVMRCIRLLASYLREADRLPRSLMASLWAITWVPRYWGLAPDGMLRRNNLISSEDVLLLEEWVNQIDHSVGMLLDGQDDRTAFERP